MCRPPVHCERGRLAVVLATKAAGVGLGVGVHHVVLVQAGVLCEPLVAADHRTDVGFLAWRGVELQ